MTSVVTTDGETSTLGDLYPSRVKPQPEILARHDQVIHGAAEWGPLSSQRLHEFHRDGFLIFPEFLPAAEVTACLNELQALCQSDETKQRAEAIIEPENSELRSVFAVHHSYISRLFARVATDERIVKMAMQILGSEVYIHQSRVNLKPGFVGREFYWHSDFETWHVEDGLPRMRTVSCSILLTENNEFNGPLMLIPGSHHNYITCVGETPDNHYESSLRRQEFGVPDDDSLSRLIHEKGLVSATGKPGTLVLFDCNTMHASNVNMTPFPRANLFFVYNSLLNQPVAPFCGKKPRPEFIAARKYCTAITPTAVRYQ